MEAYPEVHYSTWQDQGGNVGVQCTDCKRTHWDNKLPLEDPTTGKPCANCQKIKDLDLVGELNKEGAPRALHQLSQPLQNEPTKAGTNNEEVEE